MATAKMIAKVKMALRLSSEDFDAEVSDLIDEATEELERQGASDDALSSKQALHQNILPRPFFAGCRAGQCLRGRADRDRGRYPKEQLQR